MIEYTYSPEIAEADRPVILESRIYKDWLEKTQEKFVVTKVHFASVDFLRKGRQPLFIKLDATATLPDGRPVHGIVLVRGNAVGVLVVLRCEGKKYLLLVRQPRFAISEQASLEIPAGILDWTGDYRKVALSELEEEAQIKADDSELIDLMDFCYKGKSENYFCACNVTFRCDAGERAFLYGGIGAVVARSIIKHPGYLKDRDMSGGRGAPELYFNKKSAV